jgi:hypothetical protein
LEESPELPKLDAGLRWSPEPDPRDKSSSQGRYVIVAPRHDLDRINESPYSPLIFIGGSPHSTYGIIVAGEDEVRRAEKDIDEESVDKEEIDEEHGWIPYQELRAPVNRQATTIFTPNTSRSSKYQFNIRLPSETHTFITPTPEEVLHYMLESVEEFHSDVYGSFLHQNRDSGLDFQSLLRPEALRVLSSGNYSREK